MVPDKMGDLAKFIAFGEHQIRPLPIGLEKLFFLLPGYIGSSICRLIMHQKLFWLILWLIPCVFIGRL